VLGILAVIGLGTVVLIGLGTVVLIVFLPRTRRRRQMGRRVGDGWVYPPPVTPPPDPPRVFGR